MEQLKQFCKEGWDKVRHNDLIRPGNRKKKIMVLIGLSVFLLACGLTAWFYGKPLLEFVLDTGRFRAWMNEHGALGPLAFVAIRTVQTLLKSSPLSRWKSERDMRLEAGGAWRCVCSARQLARSSSLG